MPEVVLTRARTYKYDDRRFVRGKIVTVDDDTYLALLRRGFEDPNQRYNHVLPHKLSQLKNVTDLTIIRDIGLGDVLMAIPAMRAYCSKHPSVKFKYAIAPAYVPLLRNQPTLSFLDDVVDLSSMKGRFTVIDLRGWAEYRSPHARTLHRVDVFAEYLRVHPLADRSINLDVSSDALGSARSKMIAAGWDQSSPIVAISVSASGMFRAFRPWQVEVVAKELSTFGVQPMPVDAGRHEWPWLDSAPRTINGTGLFSVPELAAALSMSSCAVSTDTGIYHLAHAVGTPSVVLFTTVRPDLRIAYYDDCTPIYLGLPCQPCFEKGCRVMPCLEHVEPADISAAVMKYVGAQREVVQ